MKKKVDNFDDIVFEKRNKEYGAYDLRSRYSKRGSIALAISIFLFFVAVGLPLIAGILKQQNYNKHLNKTSVVEIEKIKVKIDEIKLPPAPEPQPEIKQIVFRPPTIVDELTNENVEMDIISTLVDFANTGLVDISPQEIEFVDFTETDIDKVVDICNITEKPVFPGGDAALLAYISNEIIYPVPAQENNIFGTVYLRFVVTKTGEIGDVQIMSSVDPILDNEAIRVIKTLPKWIPGKYNGNAVNVWFSIPIKFALEYKN
jgi:protein TonB